MRKRVCLLVILGLLIAQPGFASVAVATVTEKDVKIIARIIDLIENGPTGNVKVAVITSNDADSFASIVGTGKTIGNVTLESSSISLEQLNSTNAKVILVPEGMSKDQLDIIFNAAKTKKFITISTSGECLNQQKCAISIKSDPAVDIKMSASAAKATGVSFGSTMRMMIKEMP